MPLVYLKRELKAYAQPQIAASPKTESQSVNVVVLRADDRAFGLIVDEINDTEEIVVKPLSKQLKSVNIFDGATIMGDGKVALILDVLGLAQRANVLCDASDRETAERREGNEFPVSWGR